MGKESRRCAFPGCKAWARRGGTFCRAHTPRRGDPSVAPATGAGPYADAFSPEEWGEIKRQFESPQRSTEMEVALMRVMIRRVLERCGQEDPLRALPLVRQGVDAICRALRTDRVLTGQAADGLAEAFAVALREIGEELGLGDG